MTYNLEWSRMEGVTCKSKAILGWAHSTSKPFKKKARNEHCVDLYSSIYYICEKQRQAAGAHPSRSRAQNNSKRGIIPGTVHVYNENIHDANAIMHLVWTLLDLLAC